MKRLITSILMASAIAVGASDDLTKIVAINATSYTSTNLPAQSYNGFLDSVFLDITGTTTGTLTITSVRTGETLLVVTTSADATYRPRVAVHTTAGVVMAPQTNAYERIKLVEEQVKITLSETAAVTNTYNVWLKISDK